MTELDEIREELAVRRYITMSILALVLLVWFLITMAPWLVVGPRRMIDRTR